jgi:undecaprenyl-diphosphatase
VRVIGLFDNAQWVVGKAANLAFVKNRDALAAGPDRGSDGRAGTGRATQPARAEVRTLRSMSRLATNRALLAGLAAALLVWAFIQISSEMVDGDTHAFDLAMLRAAQSFRADHTWVAAVMRDLSGLGSTAVLTLFTVTAVGYLAVVRARLIALLVAAAVITGSVGVNLLKAQFGRARPGPEFAELVAPGMSFPSGHATVSAIVFLTVAALIADTRSRVVEKSYILAVATLMALLVGLSRIALGVHWATDVVAGWDFGAAWALAWLWVARALKRRFAGSFRGEAP